MAETDETVASEGGLGTLDASPNVPLLDRLNMDLSVFSLLVISVIIFVTMTALSPDHFLTLDNFQSMASQLAVLGLLSVAMMMSMLSGGIDLSVVSTANLAGILAAFTLKYFMAGGSHFLGFFAAIAVALVTGLLCGLFNGFLIGEINITPILATLGTMQLYMGIAVGLTEGKAIHGFTDSFLYLGGGFLFGLPVPFLVFFLLSVLIWVLLVWTSFGFKLYMMGTNPIAARFSGINNKDEIFRTYVACGILSACAGILLVSNTNSAKAGYGTSYILQSILIVVLGGVNPYGGFGSIWGVVLAVVTLQFVSSGFNLAGISSFAQDFAWGSILLVVLVVNYFLIYRRQSKSEH